MPFYPFIEFEGLRSFVTVHNFSPNNWEVGCDKGRYVNVTWIDGGVWKSHVVDYLLQGQSKKYYKDSLPFSFNCSENLVLLSLTEQPLCSDGMNLPSTPGLSTSYPNWRSTIGLESPRGAITSYQGEIEPFSNYGSLLTIGNMIQNASGVRNYLLLLNLEKSPCHRNTNVDLYDSDSLYDRRATIDVKSNRVNIIPIDDLPFLQKTGIVVVSRNMAAIPLYLSILEDGEALSFEHTHPPASLVALGPRWQIQANMKREWFSLLGG